MAISNAANNVVGALAGEGACFTVQDVARGSVGCCGTRGPQAGGRQAGVQGAHVEAARRHSAAAHAGHSPPAVFTDMRQPLLHAGAEGVPCHLDATLPSHLSCRRHPGRLHDPAAAAPVADP